MTTITASTGTYAIPRHWDEWAHNMLSNNAAMAYAFAGAQPALPAEVTLEQSALRKRRGRSVKKTKLPTLGMNQLALIGHSVRANGEINTAYEHSPWSKPWWMNGGKRTWDSLVARGYAEKVRYYSYRLTEQCQPVAIAARELYQFIEKAKYQTADEQYEAKLQGLFETCKAILSGGVAGHTIPENKEPAPKVVPDPPKPTRHMYCDYGFELNFHVPKKVYRENRLITEYQWAQIMGGKRPAPPDEFWHDIIDNETIALHYREKCQDKILTLLSKALGGEEIKADWGVSEVEIHNSPARGMKYLKRFYSTAKQLMDVMKYPVHPVLCGEESSSGGGHLHVNIHGFEWTQELLREVFNEFAKYPFLVWVFNDPNDDNIHSLHKAEFNHPFREAIYNRWTGETIYPDDRYMFDLGKKYAINYNKIYNTIEFRMFEMPWCVEEQEAHIMFVENFLKYVVRRYLKGYRVPPIYEQDIKDLTKWTFYESKVKFNRLLVELGLDPKNYEIFVERNLTERFMTKLGYRRV